MTFKAERTVTLLTPEQVLKKSPAVVPQQLMGALYSTEEAIVDPREALARLPSYLQERHGIAFKWGKCVSYIADNRRTIIDPLQKFRQSASLLLLRCRYEQELPEHVRWECM